MYMYCVECRVAYAKSPLISRLSFECGDAEGEKEGIRKAKVVGVLDEVATILSLEGGNLNGVALKVVDEALAESEGKVAREVDVSRAGLGEISVEEVAEEGPSPGEAMPVGNANTAGRGHCRRLLLVSISFAIEMKGKVSFCRRRGGG